MSTFESLTLEIAEAEKLLSLATIPTIKLLLQNHIKKLKNEEENKKKAETKAQEVSVNNIKKAAVSIGIDDI